MSVGRGEPEMNILFVENHTMFAATVMRQFLSRHSVTVAPSLSAARRALALFSAGVRAVVSLLNIPRFLKVCADRLTLYPNR